MKKFIIGLIVGLLVPVVVGYTAVTMGMLPVATSAPPLMFEEKIAHTALRARVKKEAPKDSPVPADAQNMAQGAQLYVENCAFCHGVPDQQPTKAAKGMFPLPPQLFNGNEMVTDDPIGATFWKVSNGIRLTGMPGFGEMLQPNQIWQISQLLKNADKLPDPVKASLKTSANPQPAPTPQPNQPKKK